MKASFQAPIVGERADIFAADRALVELQSAWHEIAGPLAKHSLPLAVKGPKLKVEKSVYAQELSLHSTSLLTEIAQRGFAGIRRLVFDVGFIDWSAGVRGPLEPEKQIEPGAQLDPANQAMLDGLYRLKDKD